MMREGERQVAPTADGIRRDHVARYEFAAAALPRGTRVIDIACGVGYGSQILAAAGHDVFGIDIDAEAIAYARKHYAHDRAVYSVADANGIRFAGSYGAAVCFETIEHLADPLHLLRELRARAGLLIASVPNERVMPYGAGYAFHFRHYTREEFQGLLGEAGWEVSEWLGQAGPESEVEKGGEGRTLIAVAKPGAVVHAAAASPAPRRTGPGHVAILGLGPSVRQFLEITKRNGGRRAFCDEVWGINALGDVFVCDRIFHMDDVRVQEVRAAASPQSNIAHMLRWLKQHPGPIVTSRAHPDYPGLVEFPLEDVVNRFPEAYFNSTAAYAVADAVHRGASKITVFGNDFTYPNAHHAERGRACVEFWLGIAAARGIKISVPQGSTLLDAVHPLTSVERFYGYDCVELSFTRVGERIRVGMVEKAGLPSAEEIEARYDHNRHPNVLMVEAANALAATGGTP